ncbi:hypothetical protein BDU57DRAFT_256353 [Ampelomyces quisqualis]|uniref:Uncharacterized protein n=1 Tax=Ampelomyces quisqualis TaxID=50730 RepID=A0A6A5QP19_AMPQU|nr:hypothetical protein BDU57DRAFT_256353 [Ampelomyces quisqualis]
MAGLFVGVAAPAPPDTTSFQRSCSNIGSGHSGTGCEPVAIVFSTSIVLITQSSSLLSIFFWPSFVPGQRWSLPESHFPLQISGPFLECGEDSRCESQPVTKLSLRALRVPSSHKSFRLHTAVPVHNSLPPPVAYPLALRPFTLVCLAHHYFCALRSFLDLSSPRLSAPVSQSCASNRRNSTALTQPLFLTTRHSASKALLRPLYPVKARILYRRLYPAILRCRKLLSHSHNPPLAWSVPALTCPVTAFSGYKWGITIAQGHRSSRQISLSSINISQIHWELLLASSKPAAQPHYLSSSWPSIQNVYKLY